ncbi:ShlB/FhaC/HecB family hemolysin secretion/activation protein [Paraburkholderia sp. DHOC27]|uniref:ShlB/FhaC/HecB family hemolysin secretion/activation protein n=1 Tax=Paraburkholderia sp. DHOC27 TaxID=2303330 RepID=UPI0015F326C4|nr:ShlB/FhaC/HecB family hemolysin secretion/activation protein [Paraburkholderia sp. DHOC27]
MIVLMLALGASLAQAQVRIPSVPDSGQLLRETQPPNPQAAPSSNLPLNIQQQNASPSGSTETFPVRSIEISGNTLIPTDTLHALVASGEGKNLTLDDLDALADRITQAYHAHGYPLDRAYVPAQTLHDGVVRVAVLEAKYGAVTLHNDSAVSDRPLNATLAPLQPGQQVSEFMLERSLLLMSDIPGAVVNSVLGPGAAAGTSDLNVDVTSAQRYTGVASVDDYGNRYTDRVRVGGDFDINGLFHQGDVLDLSALTSGHDMTYGRAGYRYLLNGQGTTVEAAISGLEYHLGNGLSNLEAHGTAVVESINLSQPLIRNTAYNLYGQVEYDHRQLHDDIDIVSVENNRHTGSWTGTLAGDQRDRTGITNMSVSTTYGHVWFDDALAEFIDSIGPHTQGSYTKYDLSISRLQQLNTTNALYFALLGQFANRNLDTSEQFYLGGPTTVRGYDVGALSGAQGNLATAEFRHDFSIPVLPGPWQAALFVDSGHLEVYKTTFVTGPNSFRLSSIGVGLHWSAPHAWVMNLSLATPLGAAPDAAGIDSSKVRFWAQLQKGF